jgi:ketosteroid isomerase-like protein
VRAAPDVIPDVVFTGLLSDSHLWHHEALGGWAMKMKTKWVSAIAMAIFVMGAGAGLSKAAPALDVEKLETKWVAALLAANMEALEAMYSNDLIYVHSNGGIQNKHDYLESIRTGSLRFKTMTAVGALRTRSFGNTATVSSRYDMQLESGRTGKVSPYTIQYLTVYVNEGGTWRIVAQQTTSVPQRT